MTPSTLREQRRRGWRQTPERRVPGAEEAARFIGEVGIATLFPASSEAPDLFRAHVGDPDATTEATWSSPSGEVYGWRWALGRAEAGFYASIVRNRPTWVSWTLLPAVLQLRGEMRTPHELCDAGTISGDALRVAEALEGAGGVLSTGELRAAAGFPTGKPQRAAYLKAVAELDTRLLLAKVFSTDDEDMRHALVSTWYPEDIATAHALTADAAADQLLRAYLPPAGYAVPAVLARHLGVDVSALRAGLERLVERGEAEPVALPGEKGTCYRQA